MITFAAIYGLLIGSFINAWTYRLPRGISIAHGRSFCPSCSAPIRWHDNIPLLSWARLRGRCRDCGASISVRYPLIEGLTAALFAGVAAMDGVAWRLAPHFLFVATLVFVSEVDVEEQIIPDLIILPSAAAGLVMMIVIEPARWWEWPVAACGAALFLYVVAEVYERIRGVAGMGMGDVKLALCMGAYLGVAVIPAFFIAFVAGALVGVALVLLANKTGKSAIPFGPFLAAGAVVALFVGRPLIHAYLHLVLRH